MSNSWNIRSQYGIKAKKKKVKATTDIKPLNDLHRVQYFTGMVNFQGYFVSNLAKITKPLNNIRKKDCSIWGLPRKKHLKKGHPVAFKSQIQIKTEQGNAQIEKEALAITWGCEHFKVSVFEKFFLN
ncbi:hypothetical protein LAZ67_X000954 [Cordylochernes scorpioides]|uniref:Reverse transcriptase RNase H-like domain-containing protein n=1 Tax=Cordylochernes scorpioides TaxID=51811 RepID=A0ABY6LUM0_9ARAC|nr:hypothetical protein LAZ67_X000954 [Cordylochernes scorpioides]